MGAVVTCNPWRMVELWLWYIDKKEEEGREANNVGPPRFWHGTKASTCLFEACHNKCAVERNEYYSPAPFFTKLEVCVESIVVSFF